MKKGIYKVTEEVRAILQGLDYRTRAESDTQESDFAITSITCSSMHCFMGFLLTTDGKPEDIERELKTMNTAFNPTHIFDANFNEIVRDFNKNELLVPLKCYINKNFQNSLWNARMDLFVSLQ